MCIALVAVLLILHEYTMQSLLEGRSSFEQTLTLYKKLGQFENERVNALSQDHSTSNFGISCLFMDETHTHISLYLYSVMLLVALAPSSVSTPSWRN